MSLVYLNLQVRQTERNQRALINQGAMARDTAMVQMLREPAFATAMARASRAKQDSPGAMIARVDALIARLPPAEPADLGAILTASLVQARTVSQARG